VATHSLVYSPQPLTDGPALPPQKKAAQLTRQFHQTVRNRVSAHSPDATPLACILVAILVANVPALLHLVTTNPLVINAYLTPPRSGWLPGLPFIDPNAGYTTQALGHLAAIDWMHGHVPWWNPYEGVGAPLAGEMQSGAFFPLTIVLVLHQGLFLLQLILETVTGWSTYFLIRRLGVGRSFSTAAGVAFGLAGTYAWLAHAPIRPVALLPLSLLGVERAVEAAKEHRSGGWTVLALALALSILAGFPETTFIDGIFVAWWSVLRVAGPGRLYWRAVACKLATGLVTGVALAAPLIAAFVGYLPNANVGAHNGGFADTSLPSTGLTQLILPYSLGPIFGFHSPNSANDTISALWGSVGGFLSVTLIACGLVGLIGKRQRLLRLGLGSWVLVSLLRTFGFPPVVHLMAVLPGVRLTAFYRYSDPSWELAVVALAALGLDDIARNFTQRKVLVGGSVITGVLAAWAAATAWPILTRAVGPPGSQVGHRHIYALGSLAAACGALTLLSAGGFWAGRGSRKLDYERMRNLSRHERSRRRGRVLMAGVVSAESVLLLGFTYLSAPAPTALQTGSVGWLQANLGAYRFVTLGPIQPNYGSYFRIAEANANDLPFPKTWDSYIQTQLDPNAPSGLFTGGARVNPGGLTPAQELSANLANYEAVGIRFVVESSNGRDLQGNPFPATSALAWPAGPRLVYQDSFADIWQLPAAAPVFSLRPSGSPSDRNQDTRRCTVTGVGWDRATVSCPHPSVLVRRVQYIPGWTATSDRAPVPVQEDRSGPAGLLQQVQLPAGVTTVNFNYLPPHEDLAITIAAFAGLLLVSSLIVGRIRRRDDDGDGDEQYQIASPQP
jgi:hypothetical protein